MSPASPAAGHGKRHEPGNGERWGGCSAGPAMLGQLVPVLEVGDVGDACLASSAMPSGVSPVGTGSGTGLGGQAACLPAGGAKLEEKQAGTLRQPTAVAGGVEGRGDSKTLRGRGEPFPMPLKARHLLPSTHQEPCATPNPVVPHPLLSGAGLCSASRGGGDGCCFMVV